jgi:hypothetical protein
MMGKTFILASARDHFVKALSDILIAPENTKMLHKSN